KTDKVVQENAAKNTQVEQVKKSEQGGGEKSETSEDGIVEKGKSSDSTTGKTNKNATQKSGQASSSEGKDELAKALSRLKNQVATQTSKKGGGTGAGGGLASSNVPGKGTSSQVIDLYNLELMYRIRQNWSFNERLAGAESKIEVRILIKILQNGEIRDIWFETRSGNSYLDESALKAVKKSNPLSPLPPGYTSYDIGLIFTPDGLK
ncbi:MAG: TonB C-terminal domain-containing protein, partial [Desulfamplus sp.]|nr:TonB C-terminal domain-containing protein [Desulfamplus sp.]